MGIFVIVCIVVLMVIGIMWSLNRNDTYNKPKQLSFQDFKRHLAEQYIKACQDYGVDPEWTDKHMLMFKDDYVFPYNARPIYYKNIIGYIDVSKIRKVQASDLKDYYEKKS